MLGNNALGTFHEGGISSHTRETMQRDPHMGVEGNHYKDMVVDLLAHKKKKQCVRIILRAKMKLKL